MRKNRELITYGDYLKVEYLKCLAEGGIIYLPLFESYIV